jgi:hypothetical protein
MMPRYDGLSKWLGLIEEAKFFEGQRLQRELFDQRSGPKKDHPLLDPKNRPYNIINAYLGGQQVFVPDTVDALIASEDNPLPSELRNEDGRERLIGAYLFSRVAEPVLVTSIEQGPLVTRLDGELRRFGMVLRWEAEPMIFPGTIPVTEDLIKRYCEKFRLSDRLKSDICTVAGIPPGYYMGQ